MLEFEFEAIVLVVVDREFTPLVVVGGGTGDDLAVVVVAVGVDTLEDTAVDTDTLDPIGLVPAGLRLRGLGRPVLDPAPFGPKRSTGLASNGDDPLDTGGDDTGEEDANAVTRALRAGPPCLSAPAPAPAVPNAADAPPLARELKGERAAAAEAAEAAPENPPKERIVPALRSVMARKNCMSIESKLRVSEVIKKVKHTHQIRSMKRRVSVAFCGRSAWDEFECRDVDGVTGVCGAIQG